MLGQKGSTEEYRYVLNKSSAVLDMPTTEGLAYLGGEAGCDYWEIWGGIHFNTDTYILAGRYYYAYNGISRIGSGAMSESGNTLTIPGLLSFTLEDALLRVRFTTIAIPSQGNQIQTHVTYVRRYKN